MNLSTNKANKIERHERQCASVVRASHCNAELHNLRDPANMKCFYCARFVESTVACDCFALLVLPAFHLLV